MTDTETAAKTDIVSNGTADQVPTKTEVVSNGTADQVIKTDVVSNGTADIAATKTDTATPAKADILVSKDVSFPGQPRVPFAIPIEGGMSEGQQIRIRGMTYWDTNTFTINLQEGDSIDERPTTPLHVSIRVSDGEIVRNSKHEVYGDEEREGDNPIKVGVSFQIVITVETAGYQIDINGERFAFFKHRVDKEIGNHVRVDGDVAINSVRFNTKETPDKPYVTYAAVPSISNPEKPFSMDLGPLSAGRLIYIRGVCVSPSDHFCMDLLTGPDCETADCALHINVKYENAHITSKWSFFRFFQKIHHNWFHHNRDDRIVLRNSRKEGKWGEEERGGDFPFPKEREGEFEITILVDDDNYKIAVNSSLFTEFAHRQPVEFATTLTIGDDVDIRQVRIQ